MGFWSTILQSASISSIAAIGLFLQIRSGQMNVGMAVFVGVGGYTSGALCTILGLSPVVSIPIAVLAGMLFGAAFSAVTLRLHRWFFAVTTLSLCIAAVSVVSNFGAVGGGLGLMGIPIIGSAAPILCGLILTFAIAFWIDHSAVGVAIRATGDDEVVAEVFGIRVRRLRVAVFAVGSGMAALAGALQAHRFGLYQPTDLGFQNSMLLFVYVLVGGKANVFGPVVGSFSLFILPELIKIAPETELIVYGALMIVVAVAMPTGIAGLIASAIAGYRRRVAPTMHADSRRTARPGSGRNDTPQPIPEKLK
jgi:branched-chain amino acid transport system permease protein